MGKWMMEIKFWAVQNMEVEADTFEEAVEEAKKLADIYDADISDIQDIDGYNND